MSDQRERLVSSVSIRRKGEWVRIAEFDPPIPYSDIHISGDGLPRPPSVLRFIRDFILYPR
jgi:hypothetical protein